MTENSRPEFPSLTAAASPVAPASSLQDGLFAAVIDGASDAVINVDARGRITLFNPAAERIFGRPAARMLGQPLDALMPANFRARHVGDLGAFMQSGVSRRAMGAGRVKGLRADGQVLELEASISQTVVGGQLTLTAILRDVTERVQAETELLRYQFELSELARKLMEQEKATTRRLAQALHDQLGQTLATVRLLSDLPPVPEAATMAQRQQRVSALLDQAIREVRQVLIELRPPQLDDGGLIAALENELHQRTTLAPAIDWLLEVDAETRDGRWPADVEYAAFMVAREALANALRHAEPSLVRVLVAGDARALRMEIIDDGRGIAPAARSAVPGHLGMVGMRERALAIGARFSVDPAEGGGTVVRLLWEAQP